MKTFVCLLFSIFTIVGSLHAEVRTWTSGKHKTEAELVAVSVDGTTVALKKTDGKMINIPFEKLSDADQKYVKVRSSAKPVAVDEKAGAGDIVVTVWADKKGKQYITVSATLDSNYVVLKTVEGKTERIKIADVSPNCMPLVEELQQGKAMDEFTIPDEPTVTISPEDTPKEGEFAIDVWVWGANDIAKEEYMKHVEIIRKKREVEENKKKHSDIEKQRSKAKYGTPSYERLNEQEKSERDRGYKLSEQLRELESEYEKFMRDKHKEFVFASKLPALPDKSLLEKKVKKVVGTVKAEFINYADDGTLTYRIKGEEKKRPAAELTAGDMDRIIAEELKKPIDDKFHQPETVRKQVKLFIEKFDPQTDLKHESFLQSSIQRNLSMLAERRNPAKYGTFPPYIVPADDLREEWKNVQWSEQEINRIALFLVLYQIRTQQKYSADEPCFSGMLYRLFQKKVSVSYFKDTFKEDVRFLDDVFCLSKACEDALEIHNSEKFRTASAKRDSANIRKNNEILELYEKAKEAADRIQYATTDREKDTLRDKAQALRNEAQKKSDEMGSDDSLRESREHLTSVLDSIVNRPLTDMLPLLSHWSAHRYDEMLKEEKNKTDKAESEKENRKKTGERFDDLFK